MDFSEEQLERYSRNIILREFGSEGQEKLLAASVLLVGAGGLGNPASLYLAAAGIGKLGIVDEDKVEISNLQRQMLFRTGDLGASKAEVSRSRLQELNPDTKVEVFSERFIEANAESMVEGYDIVADCSDNFETRFLLADTCHHMKKPLVSAAISRFTGQLTTLKPWAAKDLPCYRCLIPEIPDETIMPPCTIGGVIGALAGIMGSWQAMEVIKEITGIGESMAGSLLNIDVLSGNARRIAFPMDPNCPHHSCE